jgi:hypothetical protein
LGAGGAAGLAGGAATGGSAGFGAGGAAGAAGGTAGDELGAGGTPPAGACSNATALLPSNTLAMTTHLDHATLICRWAV